MSPVKSMHHSDSETTCTKCGDALVAPEWSQYMGDRRIFKPWSCTKCGACFAEISICLPGEAEPIGDFKKEDIFPSRWVA
jgi:hypothetical protein